MKLVSPLIRGILLVIVLLTSSLYLRAQDEKAKFGKVSMEDLKMTRYDKDSTAEAVILEDIGTSYFDMDSYSRDVIMFERYVRIKILTKDGYSWADQSIPLYTNNSNEEKILTLKATTFNLGDNQILETKLDKSSIFDEHADIHHIIKKFTMPSVKVGSIIEIHYVILSPYFYNIRPWSFQNTIPERYSEYYVSIPRYFHYKKQVSGYFPVSTNEVKERTNSYRFAANDIPAMKAEAYTSSMINYHSRVEFELEDFQFPNEKVYDLTSTWKKIVHLFLSDDDFGGQLKRTGFLKEVANNINAKTKDPFEKMKLAYDYLRTNMKWNNHNSIYPSDGLKKTLSDKKGNSADINLLLVLLLKELGIDAHPVLLSTRSNGIIMESMPNYSRLNYVIAGADIDGKKHLLDATELNRPYTMLPFKCMNGQGILAIEDSIKWVDLLTSEKDNTLHFGEFKVSEDGNLEGRMSVNYDGYGACKKRDELEKKGEEKFIKDLNDDLKNMKVDSVRFEKNEILSPMKLSYKLQSQDLTQASGNMIFFNVLLGMGETVNPFIIEKRDYPVDLGCPIKDSYIIVLDIPEGYSVEFVPKQVVLSLPEKAGSYKFTISQVGNKIIINSICTITKTLFIMSEYPDLREFFSLMIAKQAEKIVLKKT